MYMDCTLYTIRQLDTQKLTDAEKMSLNKIYDALSSEMKNVEDYSTGKHGMALPTADLVTGIISEPMGRPPYVLAG